MFRFFTFTGYRVWLSLMYLRHIVGISDIKALAAELQMKATIGPRGSMSNAEADWIVEFNRSLSGKKGKVADESLGEIMSNLLTALVVPRSLSSDKELVDTIVKDLQLPFSGNRVTVDKIVRLERAILRNNELGFFKEAMRKKEFHCGTCGRKMENYEMGTFEWQSTGYPLMHCYRCVHPQVVACNSCGKQVIPVDNRFYVGKVTDCSLHVVRPPVDDGPQAVPRPVAPRPTLSIIDRLRQEAANRPLTGDELNQLDALERIEDELLSEEEDLDVDDPRPRT